MFSYLVPFTIFVSFQSCESVLKKMSLFQYTSDDEEIDSDYAMEEVSETEDEVLSEDSEEDEDSSDGEDITDNYIGKDGTVWTKTLPVQRKRRSGCNILKSTPGLTAYSRHVSKPLEAFKCLLSDDIMHMLSTATNQKAKNASNSPWPRTTLVEMQAFVGILLLIGICRGQKESVTDMWNSRKAPFLRSIFPAIMPRDRFKALLQYVRFDDVRTRVERRASDRMAALREVSEALLVNCRKAYVPSGQLCIDEQLAAFRGNCPFRVYMKPKPKRYGLKIWTLCDTATSYAWNMQVYTGKQGNVVEREQGKRVVMDLVRGLGPGYGITTDNFFTSLSLAKELLKDKKTITGTIRQSRREIPPILRQNRFRPEKSSLFLYSAETMIVSYIPKRNRSVILMSTQKCDDMVTDVEFDFKPEVILSYNKTKGAVDNLGKLVREYSCGRKTRRWPLALFYQLLDIAAYNAFVIYMTKFPNYCSNMPNRRRLFLEDLGLALIEPELRARAASSFTGLHRSLQRCITDVLRYLDSDIQTQHRQIVPGQRKRGRCVICPRTEDRKHRNTCATCGSFVCNLHAKLQRLCERCCAVTDSDE